MFGKGKQGEFLRQVADVLDCTSDELGKLVGISGKSFRDWISERFLGEKRALEKLSRLSGVPLPKIVEERGQFWGARKYSRKGGLACLKKYGLPGTPEGSRKGGLVSQQRRRENPDYYRKLGCTIPNSFEFPRKKSKDLAEFVGIVLGDGGLSNAQLYITLNSIADRQYIGCVCDLVYRLFRFTPSQCFRRDANAVNLIISGKSMVEYLTNLGLRIGDKVKQQVDVPYWIKRDKGLSKYCLRGLMDTDGGLFTHRYWVNGKRYAYLKVCFSNLSQPLRKFVYRTLKLHGFNPKYAIDRHVWLYSDRESRKYLEVIGSSNERLLRKIRVSSKTNPNSTMFGYEKKE